MRLFRARKLRRPSVYETLALIGVFVAIGGVGEAKSIVHLISGSTIKKGSIPENRLTKQAIAALTGKTGAQGATGQQGAKGDPGTSCLASNPACVGPPGPDETNPAPTAVGAATSSCATSPGNFCTGWTNEGSGNAPAAFWRDIGGDVHISGLVAAPVSGCGDLEPLMFVLPVGDRPGTTHTFVSELQGTSLVIQIAPTGQVSCPLDSGESGPLPIDGIEFQPGQ